MFFSEIRVFLENHVITLANDNQHLKSIIEINIKEIANWKEKFENVS